MEACYKLLFHCYFFENLEYRKHNVMVVGASAVTASCVLLSTSEQTRKRTDMETYRQGNVQTFSHADGQTYRQAITDKQSYIQAKIQTGKHTCGQSDAHLHRWAHGQTQSHTVSLLTHTHTHI